MEEEDYVSSYTEQSLDSAYHNFDPDFERDIQRDLDAYWKLG